MYKITNCVNAKIYLGVTFDPQRRWKHHQYPSSNCTKLKRALAKYGKENFTFEVICEGSETYILELEAKAIIAYDSIAKGYNTIPGGNRVGISLGDVTKQKISASLRSYYTENDSVSKGKEVATRSDDQPLCVAGFWFPNVRTVLKTLRLNRKTLYARREAGTLHLEGQPRVEKKVRPARNSQEDLDKRSTSMLGKNAGELNGMFGKKNPARSRKVCILGVEFESIADAVRHTGYTKSQIEKRLAKRAEGFDYIS